MVREQLLKLISYHIKHLKLKILLNYYVIIVFMWILHANRKANFLINKTNIKLV